MTLFVINLLLALGWCALTESFSPANILLGMVLGYGALWVVRPIFRPTAYFTKIGASLGLALFFVWELVVSSVQVAWDVVTPRARARPGIVAVPIDLDDDAAITLLATLVSLTPGTLSLDVSPDREVLYVHAMFASDPDEVRRSIREGMERRVSAVFAD